MFLIRAITGFVLVGSVLWRPGGVEAAECQSWQELRPYLQKYYQLEAPHKDRLIRHFNALPPRTDWQPDMIGYAWFAGEKLVQLYMINGDCVVLNRYYPRQVVWKLMGDGPGPGLSVDKSGERYAQAWKERQAAQDEALEKIQKFQKQLLEKESSNQEDAIPYQDIN